jgi:hypothetical protein
MVLLSKEMAIPLIIRNKITPAPTANTSRLWILEKENIGKNLKKPGEMKRPVEYRKRKRGRKNLSAAFIGGGVNVDKWFSRLL